VNLSASKLLATLKRENPARLIAYLGSDQERAIAVKGGRKKWSQTVATVEALGAWTRVELLDKQGALLATVDNTDPAGELQELPGNANDRWAQIERGLTIVLKAQDAYAKSREAEMRSVMQAQTEMTREVTASVKVLAQLHREQLEAVRESENVRAEAAIAAAAGGDGLSQLIEALPALLQLASVAKTMLASGAPVNSSNGARAVNGVNKGGS
jgi:hypothetical protein